MLNKIQKPWRQSNHESLMTDIARLKQLLLGQLNRQTQEDTPGNSRPLRSVAGQSPATDATKTNTKFGNTSVMLDNLCTLFDLSFFDRQLLLLCAAVEMDDQVAELCAEISGKPYASLALALAVFAGHYSALAPHAPLCYYQLIEQKSDHHNLTRQSLVITPWALYYLTGAPGMDNSLQALLQPIHLLQPILTSHENQAQQLRETWRNLQQEISVTQLVTAGSNDQRQIAALAASDQTRPVYEFNLFHLPIDNEGLDQYRRLLEREILTQQCLLLVDSQRLQTSGEPETNLYPLRSWLDQLIQRLPNACILTASQPIVLPSVQVHYQHLPKLSQSEQVRLWQHCLTGETTPALATTVQNLSAQFNLDSQQLRNIAQQARHSAAADPQRLEQHLWQHSREQCRQHLQGLAKVVAPTAMSWDDLILPAAESETLKTILAQVKQRQRVYQHWGFAKQVPYGLGINALFTGSSGTGKTMAARIIASQLQLDLYHIDLSSVVDKYIGETEKKLDKIFQAAENSGAILLFDEADALFGKRSKVQDARDRYANMGISFLLQRMESYSGLSILTTNLRSAMDDAFLRRLRFIVAFPFPGEGERQRLWQLMIPDSAPQQGIDPEKLARLTLSGGSIRSIALQAAFMAAEGDDPVITMQHLLQATRQEYLKAEKTLDTKLVEDWV